METKEFLDKQKCCGKKMVVLLDLPGINNIVSSAICPDCGGCT